MRGTLTANAPLAPLVWFKSGGTAAWLFEPADVDDLSTFLADLDPAVPVMALGLGSNLIVRDGGVPGVVVRLGKAFSYARPGDDGVSLTCGGGTSGILVSSTARDAGVAGLEFLRSIPGTVGGFVRMNGGAYGRETADILMACVAVLRDGTLKTIAVDQLGYTYRHSALPDAAIVVEATFKGVPGDPAAIQAEMDRIDATVGHKQLVFARPFLQKNLRWNSEMHTINSAVRILSLSAARSRNRSVAWPVKLNEAPRSRAPYIQPCPPNGSNWSEYG